MEAPMEGPIAWRVPWWTVEDLTRVTSAPTLTRPGKASTSVITRSRSLTGPGDPCGVPCGVSRGGEEGGAA